MGCNWAIPVIVSILIIGSISLVYATTPSEIAKELGMPDITINPESGPVGTEITINVSHLPMPPNGADPRLEFYMYLPESDNYSSTLTNCDGYCIVLYSFDDIKNERVSAKEITFVLPSIKNPDSTSVQLSVPFNDSGVKKGVVVSSVCDIIINGINEFRFGYACNNYDVPVGEYEIDFGWAIVLGDVYDKRKTITFTVTDDLDQFKGISNNVISPENMVGVSPDMILTKFEQGKITKTEAITFLENKGWEAEDIREVLAIVRALEHQTQDASFGDNITKEITMQGEVTGMLSDNTVVKIHRTDFLVDEVLKLTVMFEKSRFVNYDIVATQNGNIVLNDIGTYSSDGKSVHATEILRSSDPLDVTITFQGYGLGDEKTGPIGEQVVFSNVIPEFGTISMMVLTVAIISIIVVTAKSKVIPRL